MCIKNVGLIFLFAAFTVFPAFGHCGAETLGARIHRVLPGSVSPETVSYANEVEARIAASLAKGDYPRLLRYDIGAIISLVARDHDVQVIAHHDVIAIIDAIKRILPQRTTQRLVDELMTCERSACPAGGLTLPQSQDKSARNRDYARAVGYLGLHACTFPISASCAWAVGGIYGGVAAGPLFKDESLPIRTFLLTFKHRRLASVNWQRAHGRLSAGTVLEEVDMVMNSTRTRKICQHLLGT